MDGGSSVVVDAAMPPGHDAHVQTFDAGVGGSCNGSSYRQIALFHVGGEGRVGSEIGTTERTITGKVTAHEEGTLPAEVTDHGTFRPEDTHWLRMTDAQGSEWTLLASNLPHGFGVQNESAVTLRYFHYFGGFDPERDAVELRVGGKLAFFYGRDAKPEQLEPPSELVVSRGGELCVNQTSCGDYALYALEVSIDGKSVSLGTGQYTTLGDYVVSHGNTALQLGDGSGCSDWFVANTFVSTVHEVPLLVKADADASSP